MTELETIRAALQAGLRTTDESTGALMLAGLVALGEIAEAMEVTAVPALIPMGRP